jgi:hypothetical protein
MVDVQESTGFMQEKMRAHIKHIANLYGYKIVRDCSEYGCQFDIKDNTFWSFLRRRHGYYDILWAGRGADYKPTGFEIYGDYEKLSTLAHHLENDGYIVKFVKDR